MTEKEQRFGSKTIPKDETKEKFDMEKLRKDVVSTHEQAKIQEMSGKSFSRGYGGKFGIEENRFDKNAVGFNDKTQAEQEK